MAASFLATGLAALLVLLGDKRQALERRKVEYMRMALLGFSVMLLSATLVLFHSEKERIEPVKIYIPLFFN